MIDFHLREFMKALAEIEHARIVAHLGDRDEFVSQEDTKAIGDQLSRIKHVCKYLRMPRATERLDKITMLFSQSTSSTYGHLFSEIYELLDAIERDASDEYFCHYRKDRLIYLQKIDTDWKLVFEKFKSTKEEIAAGIDCYALGYNTACVFHMSRVGEIGLRIIAHERSVKAIKGKKGIPIHLEWANWGQVFNAMEPAIKEIKQKPNGSQRDAALAFYETILSDLHAIQSLYRDQTMHLRKSYDDGEAQSAMFRVRELMATLSSKLSENSTRQIPWSAWK
jgi:hypothetical protein